MGTFTKTCKPRTAHLHTEWGLYATHCYAMRTSNCTDMMPCNQIFSWLWPGGGVGWVVITSFDSRHGGVCTLSL